MRAGAGGGFLFVSSFFKIVISLPRRTCTCTCTNVQTSISLGLIAEVCYLLATCTYYIYYVLRVTRYYLHEHFIERLCYKTLLSVALSLHSLADVSIDWTTARLCVADCLSVTCYSATRHCHTAVTVLNS